MSQSHTGSGGNEGSASGREDGSEDELGSSQDLLRVVVDSALAAVITMGDDGRITGWGAAAERTFGWPRAMALGKPLVELIVPIQHREAHNRGLSQFRATGTGPVLGKVLELSALHRNGREFPIELRISPAANLGKRTTFIGFVMDITERKAAQDRLAELYEQSQKLNEALRGFVNLVIHELRAPLTVASGYASMLLDGSFGEDAEAWRSPMSKVSEKIAEAVKLVEDLLLTARLEAGGLPAQIALVDLCDAVRQAVRRARGGSDLRSADLSEAVPDQPVMARGDRHHIDRILDNLINNSLAYSDQQAWIRVTAKNLPQGPMVTVADHGNGVPADMRERIFERFVRVHDRSTRPGSGLGLFISRQLAEQQGGSLRLEASALGEGTCLPFDYLGHPKQPEGRGARTCGGSKLVHARVERR